MFCAIYKSLKKEGMYLYLAKRDDFSSIPESLVQLFGKPQFVMLFNLASDKKLHRTTNQEVIQAIENQGFFLQLPPPEENLLKQFIATKM